jgi:hypothetical protein
MDVYQGKVLGMQVVLSISMSISFSLSLFLHGCISTFLYALHSIDATDTLNFVSVPVYDVQV